MEFILQGLTTRAHRDALSEVFSLPDIELAIISVAFVNDAGVEQLETVLRPIGSKLEILAGIRNQITSFQGLNRLLSIARGLYLVDTGTRSILFHPKIYMARSATAVRLLVGSANLTLGGLSNNIEAGLLMSFDMSVPSDRRFIQDLEGQLLAIPRDHPENVAKISAASELRTVLETGRIIDEDEPPPRSPLATPIMAGIGDVVPRIVLKGVPFWPTVRRSVKRPKRPPRKRAGVRGILSPLGKSLEVAWQSKPLTKRDLTIPDRSGTHPTGSINLDKGLLPEDVDHRHYFRNIVFTGLTWTPKTSTVEEARASFDLVVAGANYGNFLLHIRHTHSTNTRSYLQRNAMTRMSWGNAAPYVAKPELLGRTLTLSRDVSDPSRFLIEID